MATNGHSVKFAGGILGRQRHICAFFNSIDEEHRVLRSFIKDGFEQGEKAFHIVDPELWPVFIASCTLIPASASRLRCCSQSSGSTMWKAFSPCSKPSLMNERSTLCSSSMLLKKAQM